MKRLGGFELGLGLVLCSGLSACAQPEELTPDVVRRGEDFYFALTAQPAQPAQPQPPATGDVAPNPPPADSGQPLAPVSPSAPLAGSIPAPELAGAEEVEPPNSLSLEQWLQQQQL